MINKHDFLKKYNNEELFLQSGLSWKTLMEIAADYLSKTKIFKETAADFVQEISNLEPVHSVRFRIKNPEHLIEKIIRKSVEYENTDIQFNKDTYLIEITDIIGIRALYVFKSDYLPLHKEYSRKFTALENTGVPKNSILSLPPLFSGFFTYFLYSFSKFSNPY